MLVAGGSRLTLLSSGDERPVACRSGLLPHRRLLFLACLTQVPPGLLPNQNKLGVLALMGAQVFTHFKQRFQIHQRDHQMEAVLIYLLAFSFCCL